MKDFVAAIFRSRSLYCADYGEKVAAGLACGKQTLRSKKDKDGLLKGPTTKAVPGIYCSAL